MKKISKLLIISTYFLLAFSVLQNVNAQTEDELGDGNYLTQEELDEYNNLPSTGIYYMTAEEGPHGPGDTITGEYEIENYSDYSVDVDVSGYIWHRSSVDQPSKLFGIKNVDTIKLSAKERSIKEFSYQIPEYYVADGSKIGLDFTFANGIVGSKKKVDIDLKKISSSQNPQIDSLFLEVDGEFVPHDSGPVIKDNRVVNLVLAFDRELSDSSFQIKLDHRVRSRAGEIVKTENVQVKTDSNNEQRIQIENPGPQDVYIGVVYLVDLNGNIISDEKFFRYTIGGDGVRIQSVDFSIDEDISVIEGDTIEMSIIYAGQVFDFLDRDYDESQRSLVLKTDIEITNEDGDVVYQESVDVDYTNESERISFDALSDADVLEVNIKVYGEDGEIVNEYSNVIGTLTEHVEDNSVVTGKNMIIISLIALIVLITIIFKIRKPKAAAMMMFLIASVTFMPNNALAWRAEKLSGSYAAFELSYYLNIYEPSYINAEYEPGEAFTLEGSSHWWSCSNKSSRVRTLASNIYPEDGSRSSWEHSQDLGYSNYGNRYVDSDFEFDYVAPEEPGNYLIYIRNDVFVQHWDPTNANKGFFIVPITVVDPQPEDGQCNASIDGTYQSSLSESDELCTGGEFDESTGLNGDNPYSWTCKGTNGTDEDPVSPDYCATVAPQCNDDIDNDDDGGCDTGSCSSGEPADDGCSNGGDNNENDLDSGLSCKVVSPAGFPYEIGDVIEIQATIDGFNDYENASYSWGGSFSDGNENEFDNYITNQFGDTGEYNSKLKITYEGVQSDEVTCSAGDGGDIIKISDAPKIEFDIPVSIADDDTCAATWGILSGVDSTCKIVTEFGDEEEDLGTITSPDTDNTTTVLKGNSYRLECITVDESELVISGDLIRCIDPDLLEQ